VAYCIYHSCWCDVAGLTEEELEEERLHEMEKTMQSEAEKREERERIAAEEALLKARRQEEWVRHVDSYNDYSRRR